MAFQNQMSSKTDLDVKTNNIIIIHYRFKLCNLKCIVEGRNGPKRNGKIRKYRLEVRIVRRDSLMLGGLETGKKNKKIIIKYKRSWRLFGLFKYV